MSMRRCVWVAMLVAGTACAPSSPDAGDVADPALVDLRTARVVDLTRTYDAETLYWPTSPSAFELSELAAGPTDAGYYYSAYSFCTPEHGGTHLDAPMHFAERGRTVAEIPPRELIAPGVVIDMTDDAAADPDARLDVATVERWETEHGPIPDGAIVLLRTGWGSRWPDAMAYLGDDTPGDASRLHFPSYGAAAAEFLIARRQVRALGVDTASIDHGPSQDFAVHRLAAEAGVPGLENVAALDELPPTGFWVVALPVKIGRGSGGPVRVVALVAREQPAEARHALVPDAAAE